MVFWVVSRGLLWSSQGVVGGYQGIATAKVFWNICGHCYVVAKIFFFPKRICYSGWLPVCCYAVVNVNIVLYSANVRFCVVVKLCWVVCFVSKLMLWCSGWLPGCCYAVFSMLHCGCQVLWVVKVFWVVFMFLSEFVCYCGVIWT